MTNYDVWLNMCLGCDKCKGLYTTTDGSCLYVELNGVLYTPNKNTIMKSLFYNNIKDAAKDIRPVKDREDLKEILKKGYDYAG